MAAYRFLYADALTDVIIGELPLESVSFGEVLNGPGSLSGTLPLRPLDPSITAQSLATGKTSIFVERDGVIIWGGILWTKALDVAANAVTLGGLGFWSLVRRRRLNSTKTYAAVDQSGIFTDLLDTAQAVSGGAMRLTTSTIAATGVLRDRTYFGYECQNIGQLVEDLASVAGGFDFRIASRWSGSAIVRDVLVSYPNTGRETAYVLDVGTNVELLSMTEDATPMVVTAIVKGEGEGEGALISTQTNAPLLNVYPLSEDLDVRSDVSSVGTLTAHAQTTLSRGQAPTTIPSVVIYPDMEPYLGSFVVGDRVKVRGSYGLMSVDAMFRITTWTASVDDRGMERVSLTLAPLEVFS